jgi:type I restriction enzyme S subunit
VSWPLVPIGELCTKINTWNPLISISNEPFSYIDLSSLNKDLKIISHGHVSTIQPNESPSRARQLVKTNDVLISTVRPYLNSVAVVGAKYDGATASTGYSVLRSDFDCLNHKYLYFWTRSAHFVSDMIAKATGANYPAVSDKIVKSSKIPLPPLPVQKQIAAVLEKADTLRQQCQKMEQELNALAQSVFLDMFGDPVSNPKGWAIQEFGDFIEYIGDIGSNGSNATISANLKMLNEEDHALMIRTTNFNKNDFTDNVKYVSKETYDFFKKSQIFGGEIIMNKIGSAGQFWIMPELSRPVSLGLNQLVIRLKNLNTDYLYYYLSTHYGQKLIQSKVNGAATKSITKGAVKSLPLMVPSIELQNKFSDFIEKIRSTYPRKLKEQYEDNFNSLMQRAFKGELDLKDIA